MQPDQPPKDPRGIRGRLRRENSGLLAHGVPIIPDDKAPSKIQITAEQLIREALEADEPIVSPKQTLILDEDELAAYQQEKRIEFENRLARHSSTRWKQFVKYAKWEEAQGNVERSRSVFEKGLMADYTVPLLWICYTEMEIHTGHVLSALNVFERAVSYLPMESTLWLWYAHVLEHLGRLEAARRVFERWLTWIPGVGAYEAYSAMEERYGETKRRLAIMERCTDAYPTDKTTKKLAEAYEEVGNENKVRRVYERAASKLILAHVPSIQKDTTEEGKNARLLIAKSKRGRDTTLLPSSFTTTLIVKKQEVLPGPLSPTSTQTEVSVIDKSNNNNNNMVTDTSQTDNKLPGLTWQILSQWSSFEERTGDIRRTTAVLELIRWFGDQTKESNPDIPSWLERRWTELQATYGVVRVEKVSEQDTDGDTLRHNITELTKRQLFEPTGDRRNTESGEREVGQLLMNVIQDLRSMEIIFTQPIEDNRYSNENNKRLKMVVDGVGTFIKNNHLDTIPVQTLLYIATVLMLLRSCGEYSVMMLKDVVGELTGKICKMFSNTHTLLMKGKKKNTSQDTLKSNEIIYFKTFLQLLVRGGEVDYIEDVVNKVLAQVGWDKERIWSVIWKALENIKEVSKTTKWRKEMRQLHKKEVSDIPWCAGAWTRFIIDEYRQLNELADEDVSRRKTICDYIRGLYTIAMQEAQNNYIDFPEAILALAIHFEEEQGGMDQFLTHLSQWADTSPTGRLAISFAQLVSSEGRSKEAEEALKKVCQRLHKSANTQEEREELSLVVDAYKELTQALELDATECVSFADPSIKETVQKLTPWSQVDKTTVDISFPSPIFRDPDTSTEDIALANKYANDSLKTSLAGAEVGMGLAAYATDNNFSLF